MRRKDLLKATVIEKNDVYDMNINCRKERYWI